jgi:hypothetical protein
VSRLPTIDVKPEFLARGAAAAIVAGLAVGAFWGFITSGRQAGVFGFFVILLALGVGYALSEAISAATNRKRGPALQACAVAGCVLAYVVHNVVAGIGVLPTGDFWGWVATGLAAVFAANRLSR